MCKLKNLIRKLKTKFSIFKKQKTSNVSDKKTDSHCGSFMSTLNNVLSGGVLGLMSSSANLDSYCDSWYDNCCYVSCHGSCYDSGLASCSDGCC